MDFMHDQLHNGRAFRLFNLIDDFNDGTRLVTSGKENLFDDVGFFRDSVDFEAGDPTSFTFESGESLVKLDTRQFLDITFTMPHISQLTVVDGVEERKKLLARFPLRDHVTSQHTSGNRYDISKIKETLFLGLTDMTKNNPNVHTPAAGGVTACKCACRIYLVRRREIQD